jgi:predicted CXXCH cytochrome family protein
VSDEEVTYNLATRSYATKLMDFGTSCERCHGPGSAHVQQYTRSEESRPVGARFIVRPTRLDPKTSSMICAQCHSLRDVLAPGFRAGENYYDYFLPVLGKSNPPTIPRTGPMDARDVSNDAIGLWQSACFLRGAATCTTCHQDPHEPNVDRNTRLASSNNALCTQCHEDVGTKLTAHTRHSADSAGSSCVECHMPKTVISIKSTMRDHTMSLPAPENTVKFGIPNACTDCHKDKKASWAVFILNTWWPQGSAASWSRGRGLHGRASHSRHALDGLIAIAADERQGPLIQANALGYLRNYGNDRAVAALLIAARAEHPAIRSTALLSLRLPPHGAAGQRAEATTRSSIADALQDPLRSVRLSALVSLVNIGGVPPTGIDEMRFHQVSAEFAAKARLYQDDATMQASLGAVQLLRGEFDLAAAALQNSAILEPDRPSTTFLLAMARLGQHRFEDARVLLKKVPESDPYYKMAQERLKLLLQR